MSLHPFVSCLLSLMLCATSFASVPNFESGLDTPWTEPGTGTYRSTFASHLTNDRLADGVVVRGASAYLVFGPSRYDAFVEVASDAYDATPLKGNGLSGLDSLAIARQGGLTIAWVDGDQIVNFTNLTNTTTLRVIRANLDSQTGTDLVALESDLRTVRLFAKTTGGPTSYTSLGTIVSSSDILDFAALDVDGDDATEIALLTATGVELLELDGTSITSYSSSLSGGILNSLVDDGNELLAWVRPTGSGTTQELVVITSSGLTSPLDLDAIDVVGLASGDLDGDLNDDLVLSIRATRQLMVLSNLSGGTFGLGTGEMAMIDVSNSPTTSAPENAAIPAIGDFDADGDADILFASQGEDAFWMMTNERINSSTMAVLIDSTLYVDDEDLDAYYGEGYGSPGATGTASLALRVIPPSSGAPSTSTHFDVTVWRRPSFGSETNSVAVEHVWYSLPTTWNASNPAEIMIDIDETSYPFTAVYDVEIRLVQILNGVIRRTTPAQIVSLTTDADVISSGALSTFDPESVPLFVPNVYLYEAVIGGTVFFPHRLPVGPLLPAVPDPTPAVEKETMPVGPAS